MRAPGRRVRRRLPAPLAAAGVAVLALAGTAACGDTGPGGEDSAEPAAAERPQAAGPDTAAVRDTAAAPDTAARQSEGPRTTTLRVGGHEVRAEVADREAERRQGLMGRDSLPEDHGMLFVYPEQRTLSFWMRNTRIPLDIAFIDQRGTIVDIQTMEPQTEELHRSREPAMYALEMAAGWFGEHGVEVGDRVEF